jgi:hypothetical protein
VFKRGFPPKPIVRVAGGPWHPDRGCDHVRSAPAFHRARRRRTDALAIPAEKGIVTPPPAVARAAVRPEPQFHATGGRVRSIR